MRMNPVEIASKFISDYYPNCNIAILAGSVARNEAKPSSDIDIVIIDEKERYMSRNCYRIEGWPLEAFVYHSNAFYTFFESDIMMGNPALPRMCAEGLIIKGGSEADKLQQEAKIRIDDGPIPWTTDQINYSRYMITDTLEDLIGSSDDAEAIFIVNRLANLVQEFILRTNQQWTGEGKWVIRAFRKYNKAEAEVFVNIFDQFYKNRNKKSLILYIDTILKPYGGRLFDGYKQ